MIGDIILGLKKFFHQQFFCVHNYEYQFDRTGLGKFDHYACSKCKKIKGL
jgi:hypothetical protein